ncbi:molybdopterin cofactor-binding domain-containing protein [Paenibacillus sp. FSL R5-0766]|uniref:molybdopterin cofactor-binding domain-containing protein n=1 Tax=unclassified Paenibacillus TaxID=185978 RepID=UPI00096D2CA6|nr:molybdopterin cofactor-binding domain-containing protein [Paenibacillus sp. FSL R5-0765]OMF54206.1 xanthine dehydrogenase subunit D [Paenibacillus sp. FSL R5-0765]
MLLNRKQSGKRWHLRPDGAPKVTGQLQYLTDMTLPDMIHGRVLRSEYPYARLLSIDTSEAEALEGVYAVLTSKDVPGLNRFGIATPDQPVFCEDIVRYVGDAIAAVAADSPERAALALDAIRVVYEELKPLNSTDAALTPGAPELHEHGPGNVLHRTEIKRGDTEQAFATCDHIVTETYYTPRQMHAYMETEGGLFVPDEEGRLNVYAATQHGYKDRMQLARIIGCPEEDIRVVSSPIGGSFGGKDELNVQPYGALLALRCGRPVKMHNSRKESVRAGLKRHPMKIEMQTGMSREGIIQAHRVRITADTGAYATLGAPVLNFCTEHCLGPYAIPNVDVEGVSVYTNNGLSGEFRGFGGNQAIFAMEGQMDRLAEIMKMDPWEFRRRNMREKNDPGPLNQRILVTDGLSQVWEALDRSELWQKHQSPPADPTLPPWIKRGVGAAIAMHGAGLGYGIPDPAGGRLSLNNEGKIEVAFSYEEFGQGLIATLEIMLCDLFQCSTSDLSIIIGDTDRVPHSGSSTASRSTTMAWMALQRLQTPFRSRVLAVASEMSGVPADELVTGPGGVWRKGQLPGETPEVERARQGAGTSEKEEMQALKGVDQDSEAGFNSVAKEGVRLCAMVSYAELVMQGEADEWIFDTKFDYPTTPDNVVGGHYLYTYAAVAAEVEVNTLTGETKLLDTRHVVAAGPVINPMGYIGQIEGGSVMALGFTLTEDAVMQDSRYVTTNLDTYLIPTIQDIHTNLEVEAIEDLPEGDAFGPRGIGEIGSVALAPAITAAIHQATGVWVNRLPVPREQLVRPLNVPLQEGVSPS